MIRRFTNEQGKLYELYKPTLTLGTRPHSPRGILFRDYYYDDTIKSFDEELLKPIEQKFAAHYTEIADKPFRKNVWSSRAGAAFIGWVASHLCRTSLLVEMNKVLFGQISSLMALAYAKNPQLANNIVRSEMFNQYQDLLSRPQWKWKCRIFPSESKSNLVITDNPVCCILGLGNGRRVYMVPLSKKRILFGGLPEMVEKCGGLSVRYINLSLAAWAERHIYAADNHNLENVAIDLRGEGNITCPTVLLEAARKPLFGLPERAAANPVPNGIDLDKFCKSLKDSFGPSIL